MAMHGDAVSLGHPTWMLSPASVEDGHSDLPASSDSPPQEAEDGRGRLHQLRLLFWEHT